MPDLRARWARGDMTLLGEPTGARLLIVEDDADLRAGVALFLRRHGFTVVEADDLATGGVCWEAVRPDLVIIDLGLPDGDGLVLIRRVRREAATPILVLSVRDRERDKVEALDQGADDYLTKPFGMAELHARLGALLRRAGGPRADAHGVLRVGTLALDIPRHVVTVGSSPVHLTPREFEVLKVLVMHAGQLVTHARLLRAVWGTAYSDEAHYVHVYVSALRRKLAAADPDGSLQDLIVAEPGVGYRVEGADEVSWARRSET
jgi:two-component system KDP operon response regulator KdpE